MEAITTATTTVTTLMGNLFTVATGNEYLVVFMAVGLMAGVAGLFARLRRTFR